MQRVRAPLPTTHLHAAAAATAATAATAMTTTTAAAAHALRKVLPAPDPA
jgi:hypothetical protein